MIIDSKKLNCYVHYDLYKFIRDDIMEYIINNNWNEYDNDEKIFEHYQTFTYYWINILSKKYSLDNNYIDFYEFRELLLLTRTHNSFMESWSSLLYHSFFGYSKLK